MPTSNLSPGEWLWDLRVTFPDRSVADGASHVTFSGARFTFVKAISKGHDEMVGGVLSTEIENIVNQMKINLIIIKELSNSTLNVNSTILK